MKASLPLALLAGLITMSVSTTNAALLGSFTDDFNRANGPIGSNYSVGRGPGWEIVNNVATLAGANDSYTYLNVGTLPTASDYTLGLSFTAKFDFLLSGNTNENTPVIELLFNYQNEDNFSGLRYRGDGNNRLFASQRSGGPENNVELTPNLTDDLTFGNWYTLQVNSTAAGSYDYSLTDRESGNVVISGSYTTSALGLATFTGGYMAFGANAGGSYTYQIDNFSVTVVPEPSTWMLLGLGVSVLTFGACRRRKMALC